MGQGARQEALIAAAAAAALLLWCRTAAADPLLVLPPPGKGILVDARDCGGGTLAFIAEVDITAVLGAEEQTILPEHQPLVGGEPQLGAGRIGLVGDGGEAIPLGWLVRIDLSEALRGDDDGLDDPDTTIAVIDSFVDDAALWWRPRRWLDLVVGRQPVPSSRFRDVARALRTAGVVPFAIDRVTPERRWGLAVHSDLGALAGVAGVYADLNELERAPDPDFSIVGRMMVAARVLWPWRAPIGDDLGPTSRRDPWYHTVRPALGLGALVRLRDDGVRAHLAASGEVAWTRYAAIAEVITTLGAGDPQISAAAELSALLTDKSLAFVRADTDPFASVRGAQHSAGGGVSYFVTADRTNKLTLYGWLRGDGEGGPRSDGAIVQLQASL